jgi:hypothetical protein
MKTAAADTVLRPVYKAVLRPLTIGGVDRRLFFLSLLMGAAIFNLFYSLLADILLSLVLYVCARWRKTMSRLSPGGTHSRDYDSRREVTAREPRKPQR